MLIARQPGVVEATDPIYHYTDAAGLIGLVQKRVIWASEAAGMNDRAEVRQGWAKIRAWLENQPPGEALDLLRSHAREPFSRVSEVFVACASTRGDDANQWRLYARGGAGYAVELDPTFPLTVLTEKKVARAPEAGFTFASIRDVVEVSPWLHVIYEDAHIHDALQAIVEGLESSAASIRNSDADPDAKDFAYDELRDESYSSLAQIAHLIKEPGFSGENEVRMVATFLSSGDHIRYRPGAYGVVGYTELAATPDGRPSNRVLLSTDAGLALPLRSVRLGPLLQAEHVESVQGFLRNHGLGILGVTRSEVPLR